MTLSDVKNIVLRNTPPWLEDNADGDSPIGGPSHLLLNVPPRCNQRCPQCWTQDTEHPLRRTDVMSNDTLGRLVAAAHETGVSTAAIMSDGEPLFAKNLLITREIARQTARHDMGMLLFSNGQLLTGAMLENLRGLNPALSFVVSVNAGTRDLYGQMHGVRGGFDKIMRNVLAWREFCERTTTTRDDGIRETDLAIHFVITRENEQDVDAIEALADSIKCALVITVPGFDGRAIQNKDRIAQDPDELERLRDIAHEHSDTNGPTARTHSEACGYITHSGNEGDYHGITVHTLGGAVQVCPYFAGLGTDGWFELNGYLEAGGTDINQWFATAVEISKTLTDAIFEKFGEYYCLKRHERSPEIEVFLRRVNRLMEVSQDEPDVNDPDYFEAVLNQLNFVVSQLGSRIALPRRCPSGKISPFEVARNASRPNRRTPLNTKEKSVA